MQSVNSKQGRRFSLRIMKRSPTSGSATPDVGTPNLKTFKSILVTELPEVILNRDVLLKYFEKFGPIERINCSNKHKYAIVHFKDSEAAKKAKEQGSTLDKRFESVLIHFTNSKAIGGALPPARRAVRPPTSPNKAGRPKRTSPADGELPKKRLILENPPLTQRPSTADGEIIAKSSPKVALSAPSIFPNPVMTTWKDPFFNATPPKPLMDGVKKNPFLRRPAMGRELTMKKEPIENVAPRPLTPDEATAAEASMRKRSVPLQTVKRPSSQGSVSRSALPPKKNTFGNPHPPATSFAKALGNVQIPQKPTRPIFSAPAKPVVAELKEQKLVPENTTYDLLTFKPDSHECQELFVKRYITAEERYRVLEARDKILRARIPKVKVRVELATRLFGTCSDMCPEKERYMRQFQRQLTIFESLNESENIVDDRKAVKAYSRSSADQEEPLPHELRPGSTLNTTMDYLLHNIVPLAEREEDILADWYNFLWDRTRSIRKDITQQQLTDLQAVGLMEKCARFHIYCSSRLCELDLHSFEPKLNDENLMKCLQSLEHLYDDLRRRNVRCDNEPEFRAYQIMMNLNEGDILWDVQQRPEWVLKSPEVCLALKIHHIVFNKNFVAFFRVIKTCPYMVSCILHRYFFQVRSGALRSLWKSHSCPPKLEVQVCFSAVQRMLGYGDSVAAFKHLCQAHSIIVDDTIDRLVMNRKVFNMPDSRIVSREYYLIESKLNTSVSEAINGAPLGPNPSATYKPHTSFNEEGYLIPGLVAGNETSTNSKNDHLTVPGQVFDTTNSPKIDLFGESSSLAGVGNQKSSLSGFYKTSFQPKSVFGGSAPPQRIFNGQPAPIPPVVAPSSIFLRKGRVSPTPNPVTELQKAEELQRRKRLIIEAACLEACETMFERFIQKEVRAAAQQALEQANKERLEREEKRKIRSLLLNEAFDKIAEIAIQSIIADVLKEQVNKQKIITAMCEAYVEDIMQRFVNSLLPSIVQETIVEHELQKKKVLEKSRVIFERIKMRMFIQKWRESINTKKVRAEKFARDMLNFPATNTNHRSKQDVLVSLCGPGKRSVNIVKGGKRTGEWLDMYERTNTVKEDYQWMLQNAVVGMAQTGSNTEQNMDVDFRTNTSMKRSWSAGMVRKDLEGSLALTYDPTFWSGRGPKSPCREQNNCLISKYFPSPPTPARAITNLSKSPSHFGRNKLDFSFSLSNHIQSGTKTVRRRPLRHSAVSDRYRSNLAQPEATTSKPQLEEDTLLEEIQRFREETQKERNKAPILSLENGSGPHKN